jgi:hypothetical protein
MWKSSISLIAMITLFLCSCASYAVQLIEHQEMIENPDYRIAAVITKSGEYLEFDPDAILRDSLIVGKIHDGPSISLALSSVDSIYVKKESTEGQSPTTCCVMGASLAIVAFIAIYIWIESKD